MGAPDIDGARREILRQASVALGGQPVWLWEAAGGAGAGQAFVPREASAPEHLDQQPDLDLYSTLERWKVPIQPGSRWVGSRAWRDGPWVVAPVRTRPPAPPPSGRERRSRERLTLELAGLCLGLGERQAQADTSAGEELTGLPGWISAEVGGPLGAARRRLQQAIRSLERMGVLTSGGRQEYLRDLNLIADDVDRAAGLLASIQGVAPSTRADRFDAVRVVRSCIALERRLLEDRGFALEFASPLEALYLEGDPDRLFDLLVNLIRNAADASPRRPDSVAVRLETEGDAMVLRVQDHGVGIPAEHLERIFEPGFTTKGTAAGMGLARVRAAAQGFGGDVSVLSKVGEGSQFAVRLPVPKQRVLER